MPVDFQKLKADPVKYAVEKDRVKTILNEKYKNNPEFRQLCIDRNREYRNRLKLLKNNLDNNICKNAINFTTQGD